MENSPYRQILALVPRGLSNSYTLRQVLVDSVLWVALFAFGWTSSGLLAAAAGAAVFAVLCFRAFGMMHECVHSAGATSRHWNNVLGAIYGVICFLPFRSWQRLHLDHHMWTGNVERDPSMGIILRFKRDGYKIAGYAAWSWIHWVPTLAFMQHILFWKAVRGRDALSVAGSIAFIGASAYFLGPVTATIGLVIYLYMVEVINFPHHLDMPQFDGDVRFSAHEQAQFARSCIYPKWFAHHVLLNFNLHTEHHLFPAHPWYQLDALHKEIEARGLLLNVSQMNEWILKNRSLPIEQVFMKSYASEQKKAA